MASLTPEALVLREHGRELSLLRVLLAQAVRDSLALHAPRNHPPKPSTMSGLVRDHFLSLVADNPELLESDVKVKSCGEDWVRVRFPAVEQVVKMRARPRSMVKRTDQCLPQADLFGWFPGHLMLLWSWDASSRPLKSFSLVRLVDKEPGLKSEYWEEVAISESTVPLPLARPPAGTGNDDDDNLQSLVGRWNSEEPRAEHEATDDQDKDDRHDGHSDVGGTS